MTLIADFVTGKSVPFARLRQMIADTTLQEGVVGAGDFDVAQRAAGGPNMSVDVAAGNAFVQLATGVRNGLGHVISDALSNVVVPASDATNPRIDQLVLQWNDSTIPIGVGGDVPTIYIVQGVPTGGATLDNRAGAGAVPPDAVRLAVILVPALSTSVVNANIRDRRPWARGAYSRLYTAAALSISGTMSAIASALQTRIELSGVPVRVSLEVLEAANISSVSGLLTGLQDNGANIDGFSALGGAVMPAAGTSASYAGYDYVQGAPPAGTHLYVPTWQSVGAVPGGNLGPVSFTVQEILHANANNN